MHPTPRNRRLPPPRHRRCVQSTPQSTTLAKRMLQLRDTSWNIRKPFYGRLRSCSKRGQVQLEGVGQETKTGPASKALRGPKGHDLGQMVSVLNWVFFRGALSPYINVDLFSLEDLGQANPISWKDTPRVTSRSRRSANLNFSCCLARQFPLEQRLT